jgi:hypothetical protein
MSATAQKSKLATLSDLQVQSLSKMQPNNHTELQQKFGAKTPDNLGDIYAAIKHASRDFTNLHAEPNIAESEPLLVDILEKKNFFNKAAAPTTRKPAPTPSAKTDVCHAFLSAIVKSL